MRLSVTDRLRSLILSRQLKPGERLLQNELAANLGVSRTPLREALHKLASEGLVSFSPYKGAYVADLSLADLEAIYSIRTALECHAGYLAAQYITGEELEQLETVLLEMQERFDKGQLSRLMELNRRFNTTIFAASRQPRLCDLTVEYMHLADLFRWVHFSVERLAAECIAEHRELLEALRERDAEKVVRLTRAQIQWSVNALKEFFDSK